MTQNLEMPPEERTERDRLHADHKAAKRWRQHEVQARISRLERKVEGILPRLDRLFDMVEKQIMPVIDTREAPKELTEGDRKE